MCVLLFGMVAGNMMEPMNRPQWPYAEMGYSALFCIFQLINFFYFIVNMFKHFHVCLLFGTFEAAFLALVWLFNVYQWFRARSQASPSTAGGAQPASTGARNFFGGGGNPA